MFAKKKKTQYSLNEYRKLQEEKNKKRLRFQPYPWPVTLTLMVPLLFFLVIVAAYFLYIKFTSN